jgi:hypothetical protein
LLELTVELLGVSSGKVGEDVVWWITWTLLM